MTKPVDLFIRLFPKLTKEVFEQKSKDLTSRYLGLNLGKTVEYVGIKLKQELNHFPKTLFFNCRHNFGCGRVLKVLVWKSRSELGKHSLQGPTCEEVGKTATFIIALMKWIFQARSREKTLRVDWRRNLMKFDLLLEKSSAAINSCGKLRPLKKTWLHRSEHKNRLIFAGISVWPLKSQSFFEFLLKWLYLKKMLCITATSIYPMYGVSSLRKRAIYH